MALALGSDLLSNRPEPETLVSGGPYYFLADDDKSWSYIFLDSAPHSAGSAAVQIYTNRTINSTWSCESWPVI